jgi:hypothetical protein
VLPGFDLALGFALLYISLIVLIPLSAAFLKTFTMTWAAFWDATTTPRVVASYRLTFGASFAGGAAQRLLRPDRRLGAGALQFPFKRLIDALVDLPFALPTAVAGIALTAIYAENGWIGQWLPFKVSFTPLGVFVALVFIGLPFVVRTVQPVLEDVNRELEEAAATLGASRWQTFSQGDPADRAARAADRLRAGLRACARRVRQRDLHRRQHADDQRDHAAADHHQARAVRLRRRHRHRGGDAGDLAFALLLLINSLQTWARKRQGGV